MDFNHASEIQRWMLFSLPALRVNAEICKYRFLNSDVCKSKMVKFCKFLKENKIQEWESYYINYKLLKKKIKGYTHQLTNKTTDHSQITNEFKRLLDNEVENVTLFLLQQEGALSRKLANLAKQHYFPNQELDYDKIGELKDDYRAVGEDLLTLLLFVEINTTGLRKILKKFDKRFNCGLSEPYLTTRVNHPYSQLRQLYKHVGLKALVGAIKHNLEDLQGRLGGASSSAEDDIIESISDAIESATISSNFLHILTQSSFHLQKEFSAPNELGKINHTGLHVVSLLLNILFTFLYSANTYVIVPTADDYSQALGQAATACGAVIGAMAFTQLFSSFYLSAWSSRSYFTPLLFSSIVLIVGNILYALASFFDSFWILLVGRLLCGLGAARTVNRRYITDTIPLKFRMQAEAGYVVASTLGMAFGPAVAGLLQLDFKIYNFTSSKETLPGWIMAVSWLIYFLFLCICFREPERDRTEWRKIAEFIEDSLHKRGAKQPFLSSSKDDKHESVESSFSSTFGLLTTPLKVQLMIQFMLKFATEILLSESAVVTSSYFEWSTTSVSVFLACLGLTVLPVKVVVGSYICNAFQERQALLVSEIMVCLGILLSFKVMTTYSVPQYICSGVVVFVFAEVVEGVNLSVLSRGIPTILSHGTYNAILLTMEVETLARVVADGSITFFGYILEESKLLNSSLVASLVFCVGSIIATGCTYSSLR